jgi:hypothetical protein
MSRIASYVTLISVAVAVFVGDAAIARSPAAVTFPAASTSVADVPDATEGTEPKKAERQKKSTCDNFYSSLNEKESSAARKKSSQTVEGIDQIRAILKQRDEAFDTSEKRIAEIVDKLPPADKKWYDLVRKHRYTPAGASDSERMYAPVCPMIPDSTG